MAVRRQQRVLDHMTQQLGARQLAGVEVPPLGQQAARLQFIAPFERRTQVGKVVAELPKAEREV